MQEQEEEGIESSHIKGSCEAINHFRHLVILPPRCVFCEWSTAHAWF